MQAAGKEWGGNASQTRTRNHTTTQQAHEREAGQLTNKKLRLEKFQKIIDHVNNAINSGRGSLQDHPAGMAILAQLEPAQQMIQALAREEQGRENVKGGKSDLGLIMMRLDRIEKTVSANRTSQDHQQGAGPGAKPTWSEVAAGGKNRATLEVRLEPNGSQETDESKLQRIRVAIPEAKAIIPHPRAQGKVSVVMPTAARREQVMNLGIGDAEGVKLIRRPRLAMVMGIPLNTPITNKDSPENQKWVKESGARNSIKITRVEWLYGKAKLEELQKSPQKKGSIIIELATETDQRKVVQDGFFHGPLWHPVKMWDVSMRATQCYKCWKWGHTQSVCNSPEEHCGYCAGQHPTRNCSKKELQHARCAGCKQEGHFAWMTRDCSAFKAFIARQRGIQKKLDQASIDAHRRTPTPPSSDGYITITGATKRRMPQAGPGRPPALATAARASGQMRLFLGSQKQATQEPGREEAEMEIEEIIQTDLANQSS
ncbi:hypothetical protein K402DRAFT_186174 [Aulographum hederae CBS 113979]|uniref:CCHC-type domain-containing protein n=1 Tax=Aulographum hederae CBS 113979 TaxID=1176131 RepID=A0A6G1GPR0_9PEZI|nr:hypothetical protein K402DRAFT_186174 [Aulographum hederae CBS 113979]